MVTRPPYMAVRTHIRKVEPLNRAERKMIREARTLNLAERKLKGIQQGH